MRNASARTRIPRHSPQKSTGHPTIDAAKSCVPHTGQSTPAVCSNTRTPSASRGGNQFEWQKAQTIQSRVVSIRMGAPQLVQFIKFPRVSDRLNCSFTLDSEPSDLAGYTERDQTRREHVVEVMGEYGFTAFGSRDYRNLFSLAYRALSTLSDRNRHWSPSGL